VDRTPPSFPMIDPELLGDNTALRDIFALPSGTTDVCYHAGSTERRSLQLVAHRTDNKSASVGIWRAIGSYLR
jgi:hypothetical protein